MHVYETSVIERPAAAVWPFLVTAEKFRAWNGKIVSMDFAGRFALGGSFSTHYSMSGKQSQCLTTVTGLEENRLIELTHSNFFGQGIEPGLVVVERVTLQDKGARSIVIKDVDMPSRLMPWFLIPLIWLITRFGKRAEPDRLKEMCEAVPA